MNAMASPTSAPAQKGATGVDQAFQRFVEEGTIDRLLEEARRAAPAAVDADLVATVDATHDAAASRTRTPAQGAKGEEAPVESPAPSQADVDLVFERIRDAMAGMEPTPASRVDDGGLDPSTPAPGERPTPRRPASRGPASDTTRQAGHWMEPPLPDSGGAFDDRAPSDAVAGRPGGADESSYASEPIRIGDLAAIPTAAGVDLPALPDAVAEAYADVLKRMGRVTPPTLLIQGVRARVGATWTTINLARALIARGEGPIAICDLDLAGRGVARALGLPRPEASLRAILDSETSVEAGMHRLPWDDIVIIHGAPRGRGDGWLQARASLGRLTAALEERFAYALFDLPCQAPDDAARILARLTGGAIVIRRDDDEERAAALRLGRRLGEAGARVLGEIRTFGRG